MEDLPLKKRRRLLQDPEPAVHNDDNAVVLDAGDDNVVDLDAVDDNAVVLDAGDDNVVDLDAVDDNAVVLAAEVQNLAADALIPCRLRSIRRYLHTCALLGCQIRISPNSAYCCPGHEELAAGFSQTITAFHCFDRFVDRNTTCAICLLNICRDVDTGVPRLDVVEDLFTTLPWDLPIIPENALEWLFIKTPPARYQAMKDAAGVGTAIKWKAMPRKSVHIEEIEHPALFLTTFNMAGAVHKYGDLANEWRLRLYQCQGNSLFCLSRGHVGAAPEPKVKTINSNINPAKDSNTPSSSAYGVGKKSDGKNIRGVLTTATGDNLGGRHFATGRTNLGEIQVVKVIEFDRVWKCGTSRGKSTRASFYKPVGIPEGFRCLGHYCQPNKQTLQGFVLAARANNHSNDHLPPPLKKPVDYTLVWTSDSDCNFWLPNPPAGYKAVGVIVTNGSAYVTLLYGDEFLLGVRVLGKSIRDTGSSKDMVALVSDGVSDYSKKLLKADGWKVEKISLLANPNQVHPTRFWGVYTKLKIFNMTDYKKVVYLDADTIVVKNIEDLFKCSKFCANLKHSERLNSGVMVVEPSEALFNDMMRKVKTLSSYTGGDQGFLNSYYPDFPNARVFDPTITPEALKTRPVPEMERLSTLYNADVGLYMLANKV